MSSKITQAAVLMGYRLSTGGKYWAKPLGYSCLTIDLKKGRIAQWFWGVNGELCLYDHHEFRAHGDPLKEIKEFENAYLKLPSPRPEVYDPAKHHFEFASAEEVLGVLELLS
jgi:hypothetical protein